jgi:hypothetical protein
LTRGATSRSTQRSMVAKSCASSAGSIVAIHVLPKLLPK